MIRAQHRKGALAFFRDGFWETHLAPQMPLGSRMIPAEPSIGLSQLSPVEGPLAEPGSLRRPYRTPKEKAPASAQEERKPSEPTSGPTEGASVDCERNGRA